MNVLSEPMEWPRQRGFSSRANRAVGALTAVTLIASIGWYRASNEAQSERRTAQSTSEATSQLEVMVADLMTRTAQQREEMYRSEVEQGELQEELDKLKRAAAWTVRGSTEANQSIELKKLAQDLVNSWVLSSDPSTWKQEEIFRAAIRADEAVGKVIEARVGPDSEECSKAVMAGYLSVAVVIGRYAEQPAEQELNDDFVLNVTLSQIRVKQAVQDTCDLTVELAG